MLPQDFVAVHIRHTDYTTDLKGLFSRLRRAARIQRVLVVSDNPQVLEIARQYFPEERLVVPPRFSKVLPDGPLHDFRSYRTDAEKRAAVLDSILSLYLLSSAQKMFYSPIKELGKHGEVRLSGFTRLALFLRDDPGIAQSFFGDYLGPFPVPRGHHSSELLAPTSL